MFPTVSTHPKVDPTPNSPPPFFYRFHGRR